MVCLALVWNDSEERGEAKRFNDGDMVEIWWIQDYPKLPYILLESTKSIK